VVGAVVAFVDADVAAAAVVALVLDGVGVVDVVGCVNAECDCDCDSANGVGEVVAESVGVEAPIADMLPDEGAAVAVDDDVEAATVALPPLSPDMRV